MTEPVSLADVKGDLRIDDDDTRDDAVLEGWIVVARRLCEIRTERAIADLADDLPVFCQALRLTVGAWYYDREGAGETIPRGAAGMLAAIKSFANL